MPRFNSYVKCKTCDVLTGGGDFCSLGHYGAYKKDPEFYDNKKKAAEARTRAGFHRENPNDQIYHVGPRRAVLSQAEAAAYEAEYMASLRRARDYDRKAGHGPHGGQPFRASDQSSIPLIRRVGETSEVQQVAEQLVLLPGGHIVDRRAL